MIKSYLSQPHLLRIKYITTEDIDLILQTADNFKYLINGPMKRVPPLEDFTIANLFFKIRPGPRSRLNWLKNDFRPMFSILLLADRASTKVSRYWIRSIIFCR